MEVETEREIRRWSDRLEVRLHVAGGVVRLRIDARVARPQVEVARREDDARIARAEARGQRVRQRERSRRFTPAPELAVFEVADVRLRGGVALRDDARLTPERRVDVRLLVTGRLVRAVELHRLVEDA